MVTDDIAGICVDRADGSRIFYFDKTLHRSVGRVDYQNRITFGDGGEERSAFSRNRTEIVGYSRSLSFR